MKPEDRPNLIRRVIEKLGNILAAIAACALTLSCLSWPWMPSGSQNWKGPLPGGYETSMA